MQNTGSKDYSDAKAEEIDREIFELVTNGHKHAVKLLNENMSVLDAVAEALLEHETIGGDEIDLLVGGGTTEELNKLRGTKQDEIDKERKENAASEAAAANEAKEEEKVDRDPVGNSGPVTA